MQIGELAKRSAVTVQTVRFYERLRLLPELSVVVITSDVACRQCDLNFEADRFGSRCDDCAAVLTNCLLSNRQPQAGALVCSCIAIRIFYTEEWLEDFLQRIPRNARAAIAD